MASIDRADWHLNENFPDDLPTENAGTHIGMYLNWVIDNDLIGDFFINESAEAIENVKAKRISGRDFLFEECDGKFWDDYLNSEGVKFTKEYYDSNEYFNDYSTILVDERDSIFFIENNWENYNAIKAVIDQKFQKWKKKKRWQFWK